MYICMHKDTCMQPHYRLQIKPIYATTTFDNYLFSSLDATMPTTGNKHDIIVYGVAS